MNSTLRNEYPLNTFTGTTQDELVAFVERKQLESRVDELERLYLVYGSKDKPASLDNIFSLGKKGEVSATPIKKRIAELSKDLKEGN